MSVELPKHFEYFERNTPNTIEKLIKNQGDDYIKDRLKDYTFGFAKIGQHSISFVLCRFVDDPYIKEIDIRLVCSRPTSKDGIQLMELVESKAREMQFQKLSLIAVGNARLLHWYQALGFEAIDYKPIPDSSFKGYSMRKYL